ncbi:hypothetical protein X975_21452, partial [Stegodyphus mimosarum]
MSKSKIIRILNTRNVHCDIFYDKPTKSTSSDLHYVISNFFFFFLKGWLNLFSCCSGQ